MELESAISEAILALAQLDRSLEVERHKWQFASRLALHAEYQSLSTEDAATFNNAGATVGELLRALHSQLSETASRATRLNCDCLTAIMVLATIIRDDDETPSQSL